MRVGLHLPGAVGNVVAACETLGRLAGVVEGMTTDLEARRDLATMQARMTMVAHRLNALGDELTAQQFYRARPQTVRRECGKRGVLPRRKHA